MKILIAVILAVLALGAPVLALAAPPETMDGTPVLPLSNGTTSYVTLYNGDKPPVNPRTGEVAITTTNFGADRLPADEVQGVGVSGADSGASASSGGSTGGSATGATSK